MASRIQKISIQNVVGIGQLIIAALMCFSLWQTSRNLEYSRTQIELTKRPVIQTSSFADEKIHLLNIGGAEVEDFQVVAVLAAYYNEKTEDITQFQMSAFTAEVLQHSLHPGQSFAIDFPKLTFLQLNDRPEGEEEAFAAVIRYYRSADRRPFFKIVTFVRRNIGDPSKSTYLYFSTNIIPGSAMVGPNRPIYIKLRRNLRELCMDRLDLRTEGDEPVPD